MSQNRVVFIGGAYAGKTIHDTVENIRKAEYWAIRVWQAGGISICPHTNSALLNGVVEEKVFLDGYVEVLRRCDGLLLIPGWDNSDGAKMEEEYAKSFNLPIFFTEGESWKQFNRWLIVDNETLLEEFNDNMETLKVVFAARKKHFGV